MGPIRQRKALSCVDCRRRKVKCDRTIPICVRCQKGGNADKCTYVPHVGGKNAIPTPSDDSPDNSREEQQPDLDTVIAPWHREDGYERAAQTISQPAEPPSRTPAKSSTAEKELLARVIELETYVKSAGGKPVSAEMVFGIGNPIGAGYQRERNPMSDYDKVMIRGKSFSTQYFGPSFPISLLLQFDELGAFVKEILTRVPGLDDAKNNMAAIRAHTAHTRRAGDPGPKYLPHDRRSLVRMVPDKKLVDQYVKHYMETFETTYRILHVPSFMKEYEDYWRDPSQSRPDFVVQLLLVIATIYCVVPGGPPGYVGRSSARREVITRWIWTCEAWVNEQSKKHMLLSHIQIHILIFLAKCMNCVKVKREWANSGMLIRLAMASGMHREPSLLAKKISPFDCEMRRRLWSTIIEIDMGTTIDRGMTPTIDSFGYDSLPPRNIHDEEFDESTQIMPPSRPRDEFTRTSWLCCLNETLPLRMEILARINSIRLVTELEIVMQFDNKLRKVIDGLPSWKSASESSLAEPLVRLIMYEFILMLHIPLASQTPHKARFLYSVASKRDAATKCLKIYDRLPHILRLHLSNCRGDSNRAALSMCHDVVTNLDEDPIINHDLAFKYIEGIANILGERVCALGQGFHSYWIITTAYAMTRWKVSGEESPDRFAKEAGNKVIELFWHSLLANQVSMPAPNGSIVEEPSSSSSAISPSGTGTGVGVGAGVGTGAPSNTIDGVFAGFDDINDENPVDPMWDFMTFDLGSVWNLESYPQF